MLGLAAGAPHNDHPHHKRRASVATQQVKAASTTGGQWVDDDMALGNPQPVAPSHVSARHIPVAEHIRNAKHKGVHTMQTISDANSAMSEAACNTCVTGQNAAIEANEAAETAAEAAVAANKKLAEASEKSTAALLAAKDALDAYTKAQESAAKSQADEQALEDSKAALETTETAAKTAAADALTEAKSACMGMDLDAINSDPPSPPPTPPQPSPPPAPPPPSPPNPSPPNPSPPAPTPPPEGLTLDSSAGSSHGALNGSGAQCAGDCDEDADCGDGLYCFQRDKYTAVPGCNGEGKSGWDYCAKEEDAVLDSSPGVNGKRPQSPHTQHS